MCRDRRRSQCNESWAQAKRDLNVPLVMFPFRACKLLVAAGLSYQSVKEEDRSVYGGSRLSCLNTHVQSERMVTRVPNT